MSIEDWILDLVIRGRLHVFRPRARGAASRRALFLTEEVHALVRSPLGDIAWEQRVAELEADLERFVDGRTIDPKYLFLLYPARDAVWEIRSVRNAPSIRILGSFAGKDVFVATTFALREDLGGWESREWKEIKRRAGARWRTIFPTFDQLRHTDVKLLVTGALDGKYFKTPRQK